MNEYIPVPKTPENTESPSLLPICSRFVLPTRQPQRIPDGMKTVYLDDARWVDLAQARGLKLPNLATACTQAAVAPWLKRLGISRAEFTRWCGYQNPAAWIAANPTWSLRSLVGLLLEDFPA